ncbi:MAG: hypothetical protein JST92_20795, partial [Deltaproteobacteria bacterium]|nr:hypothetical protein [Deltaproteobacteria bacterium]
MNRTLVLSLAVLSSTLAACNVQKGQGHVAVGVRSSSATAFGDVCYTLTETNSDGVTEWHQSICSSQYGDSRGSASYIGPCDALKNPNSLAVTLDALIDPAGNPIDPATYTNPCPSGAACTQTFACQQNADVSLQFNLTILESASSGFVDVGINLDTVSCSAKLDCPKGETLTDPATGASIPASVIAITCTDDGDGYIYMNDVILECEGGQTQGPIALNPLFRQGNFFDARETPAPFGISQAAAYIGAHLFNADGKTYEQLSWAVAVAPDTNALQQLGVQKCSLRTRATASNGQFLPVEGGFTTPKSARYPYLEFNVPIVTQNPANGTLQTGCGDNPIGSDGVKVQSTTE